MKNTELIKHLIKENSFVCDYRDGSKTYELGEADVDLIAKAIVKKLTIPVVVRPEILDNYESGCVEHKQQKETIADNEQFYCGFVKNKEKCSKQCDFCETQEYLKQ